MTDPAAALGRAMALVRRGDAAAARREAEAALAANPASGPVLHFLGVLSCRSGDLPGGADYLRRALAQDAGDVASRINLANALLELGEIEQAEAVCAVPAPAGPAAVALQRLRGFILQEQGRFAEAAECYERVVEAAPQDWEIWNNLGNARRTAGDLPGSIEALQRALRLRPDLAAISLNLGLSLAEAGLDEQALAAFGRAAELAPADPNPRFQRGLTLLRLGRYGEAEQACLRALDVQPDFAPAVQQLGTLLEHANRLDELAELLRAASSRNIAEEDLAFLRASLLQREGRLEEALSSAKAAGPMAGAAEKAHLVGKIADRLGDCQTAFAAFQEMNRAEGLKAGDSQAEAAGYRRRIAALLELVTPGTYARWSPATPAQSRAAPVFLVGFPRSGTTLLDTVLMGHPDTLVLEEEELMQKVADRLGDYKRLPELELEEIERLRALYFAELDALDPSARTRTVIDKLPLNIVGTPLIHRIFPDARFVFAQRHPCDVVLSCFMQHFKVNAAMASFLDLKDTALLYDLVLRYWTRCRDVFPLQAHDVRYEALIEDLEAEVRPLLAFLGLPWHERVLDHTRTAVERGHIKTPSYSQVSEPLYRRAAGRWERYREQMAEVIPILAPWAERMGYEV